MTPDANDDSSEDEWRFSVEDVSDGTTDGDAEEESPDEEGGSVFGPGLNEGAREIVPGDPEPVNVLFVVLGVATTILLFLKLINVV